jgi:hypothetical protein
MKVHMELKEENKAFPLTQAFGRVVLATAPESPGIAAVLSPWV